MSQPPNIPQANVPPQPPAGDPSRSSGKSVSMIVILVVALLVGIPLCTCGGCFVAIYFGVSGIIKGSEPFQEGMARAGQNAEVIEGLGEPLSAGMLLQGNIELDNDSGHCDLSIPISGPRGSGTLRVRGTRAGGRWTYQEMRVEMEGRSINLLE